MKIHCFYLNLLNEYLENPDTHLSLSLYAWTTDKKLAKDFIKTRNMDKYVYRQKDYDDKFLKNRNVNILQLEYQPLCDGIDEVLIPMTWQEYDALTAKCNSIEDLAEENIRAIYRIMFPRKIKEFLIKCNQVYVKDKTGKLGSNINTFYAFMSIYKDYISFR